MEDGNSTIKFYTNPGNATKVEESKHYKRNQSVLKLMINL